MSDITAAVDEVAASTLMANAQTLLGTQSVSDSGSLGPFDASWGATASFSGGTVDLVPPDVVRITDCDLNYSLNLTVSFDLSSIIPDFCLPRICIPTPFGSICTPRICIDWPSVSIPISFSDVVKFTADFKFNVFLNSSSQWQVDAVIVGVPFLQLTPAATAILAAIGITAAAILAPIPFIGPLLAGAVLLITATIGVAALTGLLGALLTPFVSGLSFTVYKQPQLFPVLPAAGPFDPAVNINLDSVAIAVDGSGGEDELVLSVDISA
ncbi:MAG: hypothetical protein ACRDJL_00660 [Actinomycetota bacterium]